MSNPVMKYAVIILSFDVQHNLNVEVWLDNIESFRLASEERLSVLDNEKSLKPSYVQVISYLKP